MKPKYLGVAFLLVSLLALGGFVWLEIQGGLQAGQSSGLPPMSPLADFKVPGTAELEKMDRLERSMPFLSAPFPRKQSDTDLSVLGYIPMDTSGPKGLKNNGPEMTAGTYQITLAFEGRYRRYCVINGRLHAEGAVLPDGASVLKIESGRVLIGKRHTQRWLAVEPLFPSAPQEKS
jgi:hypothetical protein